MIGRFTDYLKQDAWPLLLAFGGVAVLTGASWSGLPAEVPIHWNWRGVADGFARKEIAASIPMRRLGSPRDIAQAALFLASDESTWMNGSEMVVDGGFYAM